MAKTHKGSGSTQHAVPEAPSFEELMKRGALIKVSRKRGEGTMKSRLLAHMARNPRTPVSHEGQQLAWGLAHPQQIRQPISQMADPDTKNPGSPWSEVVDRRVILEPRGVTGKETKVYYYTINAKGVALAYSQGMRVDLKACKDLEIVPENWKAER